MPWLWLGSRNILAPPLYILTINKIPIQTQSPACRWARHQINTGQ